jgi:hypothetical protein
MLEIPRLEPANEDLLRLRSRHELFLRLLEGQRQTTDPDVMMRCAAAAVGQYLNADRVGFFEVRDEFLHFDVGWSSGRLSLLTGTFPATG